MQEKFKREETVEPDQAPQKSIEDEMAKTRYWDEFSRRHVPEMRVIFRGGKLWREEGHNVAEHSLPQGAAVEVLADMLQLPEEEKEELIKNAICHDWDKLLEKRKEDFTEKDRKKASDFFKKAKLSPELLSATKLGFAKKVVGADESGKDMPIGQLLMFYIDSITSGGGGVGSFMPLEQRLSDAFSRHPEFDLEHQKIEVQGAHIAENKIYELLREKGIAIERPEDMPALITGSIEKKYSEYKE